MREPRWNAPRIRRAYEVDPLTCPACGAGMKAIAFITDYAAIDRIIRHLGVTFTCQRPLPPAPCAPNTGSHTQQPDLAAIR